MAAAEARAVWQRAANRCLVQEDRKRAPKLACCPSSAEQQHGSNNGNCRHSEDRPISNFMPLSWNPMNSNVPPDVRWWVQLQPSFGIQKDLASERRCCLSRKIDGKKVEDSAPKPKHEETLLCEAADASTEKSRDVFEPPCMVSSAFMKYSPETGIEELKTVGHYSQAKCRETASNCLYNESEFSDFECIDPAPLKNPEKANFDMDVLWKEGEKAQPWWQIADENELALLVSERAMQHIENCDLPRPTQTIPVHRTESYTHKHIGDYGGPSSPAGRVSNPVPGQCDHVKCSCITGSTDELDLFKGNGVSEEHRRNDPFRCAFFCFTTLSSYNQLQISYLYLHLYFICLLFTYWCLRMIMLDTFGSSSGICSLIENFSWLS